MKMAFAKLAGSLLLLSAALMAQSSGRMSGIVMDQSGAAVPNAKIGLFIPGGSAPVATTTSGVQGNYSLSGLQPVLYDVQVEMAGFRKVVVRQVKVDPGLELSMPPFKLEVSSQAEVVEVTAESIGVQTSNAEIASTVTNMQITRLPSPNRSPLAFISLQAGVGGNGRTNTTINGLRPSFANMTIDGVNIQDNFIRTNTLDFSPNMLQLDQVAEFTLSTSNTNASFGNGAAQLSFVTPSGTNKLKGNVRWFNRNNVAAANTWFNNRNGVARPFLNQNQFGGSLGGKIIKDKLFFYGDYEGTRQIQQSSQTRTVLREDARNGIFTYRDTAGNVQKANLLSLFPGLSRPQQITTLLGAIPGAGVINRNDIGDTLNTGGYAFNMRNNRTRDNITGKLDYMASTKHSLHGTYVWNRDIVDRPDLANDYVLVPKVSNDNRVNLLSLTHRWNPRPNITTESRFGYNFAPAIFATTEEFGGRIIGLPLVGNPVNTFRGQGRYTDTFNYSSGANWVKGGHTMSFGMQGMRIHADPFNDAANLPTFNVGLSTAMATTYNLTPRLPGLRAADLGIANSLLALHAGMITSASQQFNVNSRTSGFVSGAPSAKQLRQQNLALYFNDQWRVNRKLTLTAGARWEYWSPVDEANALVLLPVVPSGGNAISTLLSNATLDFAGNAVGRSWYKKDWNNVGPNVGLAYQPFGDNKTVIRAGYSINYPNDELIRSIDNSVSTNSGLNSTQNLQNLNNAFITSLPAVNPPAYKVPLTQSDIYATNTGAAMGMPDPNLVTPYVQQWNLSVQREMAKGILEVRYVGNRSTKQFRAFDYNQVQVRNNGFLTDFRRAANNLALSRAAGAGANAAYNPSIAGSQPLPFFDRLPNGGLLNNATVVNLITTGEVGSLATLYPENRIAGSVNFYPNPFGLGMNMMTNYSNANYNALQMDYTKRYASGWQFQMNYTYSKVLSDSAGDAQTRFEPFLDNDNPQIERARSPFDLTHSFKLNGIWEVPFGKGRKFDAKNGFMDAVFGGWGVSGLMTWTSGAPFSVLSGRGTLNRGARSGNNTAVTTLNKGQLDDLLQFRQTGAGPYFVNASAIGVDTRAVAADGAAPFNGQVFFNPGAGELGSLQRRLFSGPQFWNADVQVFKTYRYGERYSVDLRGDFFNLTNTPSFFIGDQNINSQNFGRITSTASGRRFVQVGMYLRF
jgi:hypothetical protein